MRRSGRRFRRRPTRASDASQGENMQAACVNPAALGGGSGELHAYLSAAGRSIVGSAAEPRPWVTPAKPIETPFVSVPVC
jgi:hypothetical protein